MAHLVVVRATVADDPHAVVPAALFTAVVRRLLSDRDDVEVTELTANPEAVGEVASSALRRLGGGSLAIQYDASDPFRLGSLCAQLALVLDAVGGSCSCVAIRVSSLEGFVSSRLTDHLADAAARAGNVPILVADGEAEAELGTRGVLERKRSTQLMVSAPAPVPPRALAVADLDLAFGHFRIEGDAGELHTNVLPRLERLTADEELTRTVAASVAEIAGGTEFRVSYVGSSLLPLQRLALEVTGGEVARVVESESNARAPDSTVYPVVLLTDLLASDTLPRAAVANLNRRGWTDVRIAAICSLQGITAGLVQLPSTAGVFSPWACPYCRQGAPLSEEPTHLSVAEFHAKEFWDLISWDDAFRKVGHWASPWTPNHFNLRISVKPVFEVFALSVAERMRNSLVRKGVLPSWVDGLVCTTGDESAVLVPRLAELLGVAPGCVLRVPHSVRGAAAGPGVRDEVRSWVEGEGAEVCERLRGKNLILVDQAAHHFHTLVALRKVSSLLDARALAFCVFVDRSGFHDETQGALAGLHYLSLYSWPSPPWLSGLCPCGQRGSTDE